MSGILIIADDLTGTADCAVGFAKLGKHTTLVLDTKPPLPADEAIVAVDADTRHIGCTQAAKINLQIWETLGRASDFLYKKVDSTLRGNIATEVAALTTVAGMAVVAPAFPALGRTTLSGGQFIRGVPVEQSPVWLNESIPGKADLKEMLTQKNLKVANLSLEVLRSKTHTELTRWFQQQQENGITAIVCDSEIDSDLASIARATCSLEKIFWVGSAGLANQIPGALGMQLEPKSKKCPISVQGPIMTVVGSMSDISQQQALWLSQSDKTRVVTFYFGNDAMLATSNCQARERYQWQIESVIDEGQDVLVIIEQDEHIISTGQTLCSHIALLLEPCLPKIGALIATGGETARSLLDTLSIRHLRVIDEIETGIVLSTGRLTTNDFPQHLPVITKAGGFGKQQTLLNAWNYLDTIRDTEISRAKGIS